MHVTATLEVIPTGRKQRALSVAAKQLQNARYAVMVEALPPPPVAGLASAAGLELFSCGTVPSRLAVDVRRCLDFCQCAGTAATTAFTGSRACGAF